VAEKVIKTKGDSGRSSEKKRAKITTSKTRSNKEPQTMDELLAFYGGGSSGFSRGDQVEGEVIEILPGKVIIDIGGKSEGLVAEKAYQEAELYIKSLKVGDKIQASVIVPETPDGYTILSLRKAARDAVWGRLEKLEETAEPIFVNVKSVNPSGLIVDVYNLNGFIPSSQLGKHIGKNTQTLVDKQIEAVVIDIERESRKVVLSEKEVSEKEEIERTRGAMKKVKINEIYEGQVTSIYDFGCFVKIAAGSKAKSKKDVVEVEGLVHISELSWEKVEDPADVVAVGDQVKVKVIGKGAQFAGSSRSGQAGRAGRLALSIKQAEEDPWKDIAKNYKKDQKVEGKVVRVSDFGVFVQLEPGVEGLIHVTKIPPGKKLAKSEKVNVYIEEIDTKERRISLGMVLTEKPVGYK